MSNRKIIEDSWISYAESVIPKTAPPVQYQECKRAFFAGATGLLGGIMKALDPGTEPTEADFKQMVDIQDELEAFAADMLKGRQ